MVNIVSERFLVTVRALSVGIIITSVPSWYQCRAAPIGIETITTTHGVVNALSVKESLFDGIAVQMVDVNDPEEADYLLLVDASKEDARLFEIGNSDLKSIDAATLSNRPQVSGVVSQLLPDGFALESIVVSEDYVIRRRELPQHLRLVFLCEVSGPNGLRFDYLIWKPDDSHSGSQSERPLTGRSLMVWRPDVDGFGVSWVDQGPVGTFREMSLVTRNEYCVVKRVEGGWVVSAYGVAEVPWKTYEDAFLEINAKNPDQAQGEVEGSSPTRTSSPSAKPTSSLEPPTPSVAPSASLYANGSSDVASGNEHESATNLLGTSDPAEAAPSPLRPPIPEPMGSVSADPVEGEPQSPGIHQPSYSAWRLIVDGMTKTQVLDLLGHPVAAQKPTGPGYLHTWNYGTVVPKSQLFPEEFAFMIWFSDDKVVAKEDPFGGVFSDDGRPSAPRLIIPTNDQAFEHCPRIVDMRWYPCSGEYPMQYDVEFDTLNRPGGWRSKVLQQDTPFLAVSFGGNTKGRWRVRGKNSKGEGPWSEYRYFEFTR